MVKAQNKKPKRTTKIMRKVKMVSLKKQRVPTRRVAHWRNNTTRTRSPPPPPRAHRPMRLPRAMPDPPNLG